LGSRGERRLREAFLPQGRSDWQGPVHDRTVIWRQSRCRGGSPAGDHRCRERRQVLGPQEFNPLSLSTDLTANILGTIQAASYSFHLWTTLVLRTGVAPASLARPCTTHRGGAGQGPSRLRQHAPGANDFQLRSAANASGCDCFSIFGGAGAVLAVVGIYGVMSYSVSRRHSLRSVFVWRMAPNSETSLNLVLSHGLKLALIGVMIGIAGSLTLTRLIKGYLYEVKPSDPLTFLIVGPRIDCSCARRFLYSGPTRNEGRSDGGAPLRMKRSFFARQTDSQSCI